MSNVLGKNVVLMARIDGNLQPIICAESVSAEFTAELLPASTKGDGYSKRFVYQSKTASISLSGVLTLDAIGNVQEFWDLLSLQDQFLPLDVAIVFEADGKSRSILCNVLFPTIGFSAGSDGFATQSITMQVNGSYTIEDVQEACTATINGYTILSETDSSVTMQFSVNAATDQISFDLDNIFVPVNSSFPFTTTFVNLSPGIIEIVCTPYCVTGQVGEPFTLFLEFRLGNYVVDADGTFLQDANGDLIIYVEGSTPTMSDFETADFETADFN